MNKVTSVALPKYNKYALSDLNHLKKKSIVCANVPAGWVWRKHQGEVCAWAEALDSVEVGTY